MAVVIMQACPPLEAPVAWVPPLRACDLCEHGRDIAGMRYCVCTDVVMPHRQVPVQLARSVGGTCGIDAKHMAAPFLRRPL